MRNILFSLFVVAGTAFADADRYTQYVGQSLWVNPKGPGTIVYSAPDIKSERTPVKSKKQFTVIEEVKPKTGSTKWLRIRFDDGSESYLYAAELINAVGNPQDGAKATLTKFLPDDPDKIETALQQSGGVRIGMSPDDVLKSNWGAPTHKNVTRTGSTKREQWVYPGRAYLYFDNDKLTAIQQRQ